MTEATTGRRGRRDRGAEEARRPRLRARDHRLRLPLLRLCGRRPGRQHAPAVPDQHPHDQAALHGQARGHPPAQGPRGRRRRRLRRRLHGRRVPLPQGQPLGAQAHRPRQGPARRAGPRARARRDVQHVVGRWAPSSPRSPPSSPSASGSSAPTPPRRGVSPHDAARAALGGVAMADEAAAATAAGHRRERARYMITAERKPFDEILSPRRRQEEGPRRRLRHLRRHLPHRRRERGRDPRQRAAHQGASRTAARSRSSTPPPSASASGSTST